MSAARKPKRQEQPKLVLKLDREAAPDPAIGATIWDWMANRNLWTPSDAQEKLISFAEYDDLDNTFLGLLTLMAESGLHWAKDERPNDKTLAVMVRHLTAYVRATKQSRPKMEKVFVQDGVAYRPLMAAARLAQAPRKTLHNWIKNKIEFAGRQLQTYYIAALDRYLVSDESIERVANRFVKWRNREPGEPAGTVTIGPTKDKGGYLGTTEAARILGVSSRTAWLWAKEGRAPTQKPLDVIQCTTSEHFYIREKDVYELKKLIPKSGLSRGRRPRQLTP